MLEGPADKQLSAALEGEVPHSGNMKGTGKVPRGERLVGCGLWGGRGAAFVQGLKGDEEWRGLWGGLSAPDLEQPARRRLPAKKGGGPEPGPGGWGWGQADPTKGPGPARPHLLAGSQVSHPK